jgi:hypothetical protein
MDWLELYKPQSIKDLKINNDEILKAINWIESYKKDCINTKKVLFIYGNTGVGKTLLAELILKDYNYKKIELNSTDIRSQKKFGEFLIKSLTYKNVIDMFNDNTSPIGILLDEVDTICKLSDKGGMTELLTILKQNDKFEILKKNINEKKKIKKTKNIPEDYIKLYNPIICTSNDINDKKLNELKKYSEVIYLNTPTFNELYCILSTIYEKHKQLIDEDVKKDIIENCQGDIRRLIIILENLHIMSNGTLITKELFTYFLETFKKKEEDIQLFDSTKMILTKNLTIHQTQVLFDIDCLLTPLMVYQNSIEYIKKSEDTLKKKINTYKNILGSLCIQDTIQTNIFEVQDWDELYDYSCVYGCTIPNFYFNQLKLKNKEIELQSANLLNKISQMYVNKKLLTSAKFSIGKLNYDNDEIIFLTEIVSFYFNNYKNIDKNIDKNISKNISKNKIYNEDEEDDEEEDEDEINEEKNYQCQFKKISLKNNNNDNDLIVFMNKFNININGLENILKMEKLNQINDKKKKNFTLKLKKDINSFLHNQNFELKIT